LTGQETALNMKNLETCFLKYKTAYNTMYSKCPSGHLPYTNR
jgi:hypothetical protein